MDRQVALDGERSRELVNLPGWELLAGWIAERMQEERDRMERGVSNWDEYQRSVGLLEAYRAVLDRPLALIEAADAQQYDTGDDE